MPGGYQRSTPQPRDTPTPQGDERGPTAEFPQSAQSLQPMGSLAEMRRRSRGSPSIDYQSDVSGCSRDSALVHRPSTAPPVPQDLMNEPLSQAFSVCQIDLAARRIRPRSSAVPPWIQAKMSIPTAVALTRILALPAASPAPTSVSHRSPRMGPHLKGTHAGHPWSLREVSSYYRRKHSNAKRNVVSFY
ncbi:hypothetical protein HPB52_006916 [Rhipicephalus sanguineus]|uniref:Uncharacterized protein n=1 Tax=Rhipicephalus sanguineus TaxID=34632 RepID=A0A9D4QIW3_RHISA|nr:hypothetical protein HPB52_006916 [Rhipicephalus sanguineus]